MNACPLSADCPLYQVVEPSVLLRIKYAAAHPYCRRGQHEDCALHVHLRHGRTPPPNLMPGGDYSDYLASLPAERGEVKVLIVDNSPVFAMIARNAVEHHLPHACVTSCHTYDEAEGLLLRERFSAMVCGYGLGEGKTAHDLRRICSAPMVLLTGRPVGEIDPPQGARVVQKGTGPAALRAAIGACLAE